MFITKNPGKLLQVPTVGLLPGAGAGAPPLPAEGAGLGAPLGNFFGGGGRLGGALGRGGLGLSGFCK